MSDVVGRVPRAGAHLETLGHVLYARALYPLYRAGRQGAKRLRARARTALVQAELGQSMVEYAVILAVIAIAVLGTMQLLGTQISAVFTNILGKIQGLGR